MGGGFGMLARKMGMLCDSLMAVQMVDAKGEVVYADQYVNPGLLWASRGPDIFIKDWPNAYYGANYPELMRIKASTTRKKYSTLNRVFVQPNMTAAL
jgi:hypothetical protein